MGNLSIQIEAAGRTAGRNACDLHQALAPEAIRCRIEALPVGRPCAAERLFAPAQSGGGRRNMGCVAHETAEARGGTGSDPFRHRSEHTAWAEAAPVPPGVGRKTDPQPSARFSRERGLLIRRVGVLTSPCALSAAAHLTRAGIWRIRSGQGRGLATTR